MTNIRVLPPETARLIAAGEVIDRPASVLRELLDNAIDAGAGQIEVRIEQGGIRSILVSDDGSGMSRADLAMSILPHATSKISCAHDLLAIRTLGFRGEALSSIAAVACIEMTSFDGVSTAASRLTAGPGVPARLENVPGNRGTTILVSGIFDDYPARRQFLKRAQAEAALCRQVYQDKAIAHPGVAFRWISGSQRETRLAEPRIDRIQAFHPDLPHGLLRALACRGQGFTGEVVLCGPSFHRPDRRLMQVFVNRRRVQEWSVLNAVEYAFSAHLPGGMKPCAFVFLEVDPALADFNIHPAKREVRFKNANDIREALVQEIRLFLDALEPRADTVSPLYHEPYLEAAFTGEAGGPYGHRRPLNHAPQGEGTGWEGFLSAGSEFAAGYSAFRSGTPGETGPAPTEDPPQRGEPAVAGIRFLGRLFGPYLMFVMDEALYILDQHAAHERIIFDRLGSKRPEVQELLVPAVVEPEDDAQDGALGSMAAELEASGYRLGRSGTVWEVRAVPAILGQTAIPILSDLVRNGGGDSIRRTLSGLACRAAVRDGDILDTEAALSLIRLAVSLPEPRCPHGRPLWIRLDREHIDRLVGRTV